MSEKLKVAIQNLQSAIREEGINPAEGLGEPLFLLATSLVPITNIDLFIVNEQGQLLFLWRDDEIYGQGWHIPGGCVRIRESLTERILKTAEIELGIRIEYAKEPIVVREGILKEQRPWLKDQLVRSHHISFMYASAISTKDKIVTVKSPDGSHIEGDRYWFDEIPCNLLKEQMELYGDVLNVWFQNKDSLLSTGFNIHLIAERLRQIFRTKAYEAHWR